MKKIFLSALLICSTVLVAACGVETGKQSMNEQQASGEKKVKTIGLFMTHLSNEFTVTLSGSVEKQVKARGYEYKVYDAKQDAANQQNQVEQAIASGIDGIVIEPVSVDGIVPAVKLAKEQNIPVVIVNQRISEPESASCYIGADAVKTGSTLMEVAAKDIGGKGNIAFLMGPMGSDAQVGRLQGFEEVLKNYPDISVIYQTSADWQTEKALTTTENWLSAGKDLVAIVAQNDGMAIGAAKAVEDAGLKGKVFVYGIDATKDGLAAVIKDDLKASVGQGTAEQGRLAADACADLLEGKTVEKETIVKNDIFNKDNAQNAINAMK